MKVRRVGKKDRLYSKDAIKFFGDSVSLEQLKELAPVLSKWRNRKCLKYDRIESVVNLQSEEHSSRGLRRILNDKGVAESAESCIATWLLGIVSLDELNRKKASVCLSKILLGTGDTSLERNWIQNRRLFWHSAFIAAFTSLSACIIVAITIRNDLCMCGVTVPIQDDSEILSIIGTFLAGLISISIPLLLMITLLTLVLLPFVAILTKILNRRKMDFIRSYSARSLGRIAHPLSSRSARAGVSGTKLARFFIGEARAMRPASNYQRWKFCKFADQNDPGSEQTPPANQPGFGSSREIRLPGGRRDSG